MPEKIDARRSMASRHDWRLVAEKTKRLYMGGAGSMSGSLAIVTPVFNRAKQLPRLYRSLCGQTCQDFIWYVVDDGSTDESWEVIKAFAASADIEMKTFRKENGGKHTAVNLAVRNVEEPLTFIVDSDDWLPLDSVETILEYFRHFEGDSGICGISFLRNMINAPREADEFPEAPLRGTYMDVRVNMGISGDKAEVFYTRCLKENPFPEFVGERFYHEDGVWVRLSTRYAMYHINEVVYEGRYLDSGLTLDGRKLKLESPLGMMDRSEQFLTYPGRVIISQKIKHAIIWDIFSSISKKSKPSIPFSSGTTVLCKLLLPVSLLIKKLW